MRTLLFTFLFAARVSFSATTYYVDFAGGNDASAGTSTGTAWKTIPGTRTASDSGYVSATYGGGTVSTSAKVQADTTFMLKGGTTYATNVGGKILISSIYYETNASVVSPITLKLDTNWNSSPVTFDGTGATLGGGGFGLIHLTVNSVKIDGVIPNGIIIQNSPYDGISLYVTSYLPYGPYIYRCFFTNNGTTYAPPAAESASAGQIQVPQSIGGIVGDCVFDGNSNRLQAVSFGETRATNWFVYNCTAYRHSAQGAGDGGISFKCQNGSDVTFSNITTYHNYKGFDLGQEGTDRTYPMSYKVLNSTVFSNNYGINFSGDDYGVTNRATNSVNWYMINNLVYANSEAGSKSYNGVFNLYAVHNIFTNNYINLMSNQDGASDTKWSTTFLYNNIFATPSTPLNCCAGNVTVNYWYDAPDGNHLHFSDYNYFSQTGSERWMVFGGYGGGSDVYQFAYGANGPGHSSGTWYAFQSWNNDAFSRGTGASDTTAPPLDVNNVPTASYAGMDLSGESWYITEMGLDRAGVARSEWTVGMFEYNPIIPYVTMGRKGARMFRAGFGSAPAQ